jgi:hypothetical protein
MLPNGSSHPLPSRAICLAAAALFASLVSVTPGRLDAQIIQIKTLPIADGDQFRFFPSANNGLGGVSIALPESLSDPFDNPAKGARLNERRKGVFFGSPTTYSLSKNAGGGRTLPLGGIVRSGSTFGGFAVALQELDKLATPQAFFPPGIDVASLSATNGTPAPVLQPGAPSRQNKFAFATLGHIFDRLGVSVGASAMWSGLNDVDGVDQLYTGSQRVEQHGSDVDVRLAMLKEWSGGRSFEGMLLHDRFNMTHDVTWLDQVWNPNTRTLLARPRIDHNLDRTNNWGMHLAYSQPVGDSGWRVGAIATTNLMSHPKLPDFQITQVMVIPWDPGHSAAYDLGLGIAKTHGLTTFGLDAIYEPIHTHTWGETPDSITTSSGTIPAGAKTTENHFWFRNAIVRTGLGQEIKFDTAHTSIRALRLEGGLALRAINYTLNQSDHVMQVESQRRESWMEWTRTWGLSLRFSDLELRYTGRTTTGTGRPNVHDGDVVNVAFASTAPGTNFISAPSGTTTLTGVAVTTHQISVSVPIR